MKILVKIHLSIKIIIQFNPKILKVIKKKLIQNHNYNILKYLTFLQKLIINFHGNRAHNSHGKSSQETFHSTDQFHRHPLSANLLGTAFHEIVPLFRLGNVIHWRAFDFCSVIGFDVYYVLVHCILVNNSSKTMDPRTWDVLCGNARELKENWAR